MPAPSRTGEGAERDIGPFRQFAVLGKHCRVLGKGVLNEQRNPNPEIGNQC
jgi:hypothetical protein